PRLPPVGELAALLHPGEELGVPDLRVVKIPDPPGQVAGGREQPGRADGPEQLGSTLEPTRPGSAVRQCPARDQLSVVVVKVGVSHPERLEDALPDELPE